MCLLIWIAKSPVGMTDLWNQTDCWGAGNFTVVGFNFWGTLPGKIGDQRKGVFFTWSRPPERVPGDKFLSLPWKMWWKFRKFWEWQVLSHFSLGKSQRKFATKNPPSFHAGGGGGGKNAKFHHLNLLGAALRNLLEKWSLKNVHFQGPCRGDPFVRSQ